MGIFSVGSDSADSNSSLRRPDSRAVSFREGCDHKNQEVFVDKYRDRH
ncbi:hypothetical protein SAMCFNEI73_Ch1372 [Sinorhizobium americanum]|uniref:Uncharacterized protein n=1 Tax=Sinorhizobium americanum TaxID=194963 RepID=A0A1L3LKS2_9HYPH|nr:hypothetical protein SAMCFNEI73_Ch1372 [Sinorhizobium americanum]